MSTKPDYANNLSQEMGLSYDRPKTKAELMRACLKWRKLDRQYGTEMGTPLHHDNRCELHSNRV